MKIGLIGLGKMGQQIGLVLANAGHEVIATDINPGHIHHVQQVGVKTAANRDELVTELNDQTIIWLMIPAEHVEAELTALAGLLPHGSIIIDGGNSDYRLTKQRAISLAAKQITLVDVGTSGGILSGERGFSMMIGGEESAVKRVEPIITALAQPEGWAHVGSVGAGHFVKMIHNAIEYGMMEAYAEGYHLLHENDDYLDLDLAKVANIWQHGSIVSSTLNEVIGVALSANPSLEGIEGFVAESGEARWALETAKEQNIAMPTVQIALDVRLASQRGDINFATKLLAAMRNIFGGHEVNKL